jgi:hypothetical protein
MPAASGVGFVEPLVAVCGSVRQRKGYLLRLGLGYQCYVRWPGKIWGGGGLGDLDRFLTEHWRHVSRQIAIHGLVRSRIQAYVPPACI